MPRDINAFEAGKRAHADVVKLRQKKGVDEMAAIDRELGVIDGFLRDLEPRWARTQESPTPSPIQLGFRFARARDKVGQIEAE